MSTPKEPPVVPCYLCKGTGQQALNLGEGWGRIGSANGGGDKHHHYWRNGWSLCGVAMPNFLALSKPHGGPLVRWTCRDCLREGAEW